MKKLFCLFIVALLLCVASALGEEDAARMVLCSANDAENAQRNISCETVLGDMLYCLDSNINELIICDMQSDTAQLQYVDAVIYDEPSAGETHYRVPICIFADGTQLYAMEKCLVSDEEMNIAVEGLGLYALSLEDGLSDRLICDMSYDGLVNDNLGSFESIYSIKDLAVTKDGHVAVLYRMDSGNRCDVLNLLDGSVQTLDYDNIAEVESLGDGEMLMMTEEDEGRVLYRLDAGMNATQLGTLSSTARGLAVSGETLYYMDAGVILAASVNDISTPQRWSNCSDVYTRGRLYGDNYYLACSAQSIALYPKTKSDVQTTLTISGNGNSEALEAWFEAHPEVQRGKAQSMSGEELISAFLTRSTDADIYFLSTTDVSPYRELRDKGYLPAPDSAVIDSAVGEMYAVIQETVTLDGEIVGLPVSAEVRNGMGINKTAWAAIGKSSDEIPKTWSEYLRFITEEWQTLAAQYPNVYLFADENGSDWDDSRQTLFLRIMAAYELARDYYDNEIDYDDSRLREILAMVEQVDFESYTRPYGETDALVLFPGYPEVYRDSSEVSFMPLVFFDESEPTVGMSLTIAVLNPYSENRDTALNLLEYLAEQIGGKGALFMCPNRGDEGVRWSNYESTRQESLDKIEDLTAQLEANDNEIERRQLQEDIEYEQEFLEEYDNVDGWEISPEDVLRYRSYADHIAIEYDEVISDSDWQTLGTMQQQQYFAGEITLDTYLDKLNRITTMREAEG